MDVMDPKNSGWWGKGWGDMTAQPLVSIGIPTYNRADLLDKAIASAVAQTYPHLEIVISDNHSTDPTESLVQDWCQRDPRIRYHRHFENIGPYGNFRAVLKEAHGEYFMWLGDDDWIDPNYVQTCWEYLQHHPGTVLVSGQVTYYHQGQFHHAGEFFQIQAADPCQRVLQYYQEVFENGIYYGLMPRHYAEKLHIYRALASDCAMVASLAFQGAVVMVADTHLHREFNHVFPRNQARRILQNLGLRWLYGLIRRLIIAKTASHDILTNPVYEGLGWGKRLRLAVGVWITVVGRKRSWL